jgi:hypothetical protein
MATDKLIDPHHLQRRISNRSAELFELVRGCADLTPDVIARIVHALIAAGYRKEGGT